MEKPFIVALVEAFDLLVSQRIAAEVRFFRKIERAFGGLEQAALVYRAWIDVSENSIDA